VGSDGDRAATAIVTGAGGWLGQNLVRALAPERRAVRCLVARAEDAPLLELVAPSVEVLVGDVRDPSTADRLFAGAGRATVFHAAGVIHPGGRTRTFFDVNVGGTQYLLDRARRARAGRFLHVSSNSVSAPTRPPTTASPRTPRSTPTWGTASRSWRPRSWSARATTAGTSRR
jgi:nucleoside-diphosphate-sugar epimerase